MFNDSPFPRTTGLCYSSDNENPPSFGEKHINIKGYEIINDTLNIYDNFIDKLYKIINRYL